MKKQRSWVIFRWLALFVQVAVEILTAVVVIQLNILPDKLLALFIAVLALLVMCSALLMFVQVKGKIGLWRKISSAVLALLIVCGSAVVAMLAMDAYRLIHNVTNQDTLLSARDTYLLVQNEDPAQTLADTKGYVYGAVENYDVEQTQKMIGAIETETGESTNLQYFDQSSAMANALFRGDVDAIVMNGTSIAFLIEEAEFADFMSRVRILHTLHFETQAEPNKTPPVEEVVTSPFVVYISGSDTRSDFLDLSLSDVNILVAVNPKTKQILLLNTPRDYFVPNPAGNGALDKLTHCGKYGIDCSIEVLETLYDVEIDYYGRLNFKGFEALIDAIGGITFTSDKSFQARDTYIKAGENKLTGAQALDVARERYHVSGGDNGRGKNQMKLLTAVIEKVTSSTALISNYSQVLKSLEGMFATSFRPEEVSALVKMQLDQMPKWSVQSVAVTGTGGSEVTYSYRGESLYVMWPNEKSVKHASTLVQRVLDGETLTKEDIVMP